MKTNPAKTYIPEKIYIEVFWQYRPETLRTSAKNFLAFLEKLKAHQPTFFDTWYEQKESLEETLQHKVAYTYESVRDTFSKTVDEDKIFFYPPNFTAYTNGEKPARAIVMEASLGFGEGAKEMPNSCMIQFPQEGPSYDFYQKPSHLLALMKLMIAHWAPSYIEIYNYKGEIDYPFPDNKLLKAIKKSFCIK